MISKLLIPVLLALATPAFSEPVTKDSSAVVADSRSKSDSTVRLYHANGKIRLKGKMRDSVWHGVVKEYNEQGNIIRRTRYKRGVRIKTLSYNDRGQLYEIIDRKGKVHHRKECGC